VRRPFFDNDFATFRIKNDNAIIGLYDRRSISLIRLQQYGFQANKNVRPIDLIAEWFNAKKLISDFFCLFLAGGGIKDSSSRHCRNPELDVENAAKPTEKHDFGWIGVKTPEKVRRVLLTRKPVAAAFGRAGPALSERTTVGPTPPRQQDELQPLESETRSVIHRSSRSRPVPYSRIATRSGRAGWSAGSVSRPSDSTRRRTTGTPCPRTSGRRTFRALARTATRRTRVRLEERRTGGRRLRRTRRVQECHADDVRSRTD